MHLTGKDIHYRELNKKIKIAVDNGETELILDDILGHRYICVGIKGNIKVRINGLPGNNLGAFMDGPEIITSANAQDGVANTMNNGRIIINGDTGDITGHSMRGGEIYVKGKVGFRVGIHMKEYKNIKPKIIIGYHAGDFLGEYMAGGLIILLNLNNSKPAGYFAGTGMHGGEIFLRSEKEPEYYGKEVKVERAKDQEKEKIKKYIENYARFFKDLDVNTDKILSDNFFKLYPGSSRPYGKIYTS